MSEEERVWYFTLSPTQLSETEKDQRSPEQKELSDSLYRFRQIASDLKESKIFKVKEVVVDLLDAMQTWISIIDDRSNELVEYADNLSRPKLSVTQMLSLDAIETCISNKDTYDDSETWWKSVETKYRQSPITQRAHKPLRDYIAEMLQLCQEWTSIQSEARVLVPLIIMGLFTTYTFEQISQIIATICRGTSKSLPLDAVSLKRVYDEMAIEQTSEYQSYFDIIDEEGRERYQELINSYRKINKHLIRKQKLLDKGERSKSFDSVSKS